MMGFCLAALAPIAGGVDGICFYFRDRIRSYERIEYLWRGSPGCRNYRL